VLALVLFNHLTDRDLHSQGDVLDGQDMGVIDEGQRAESEHQIEVLDSDPVIVHPGAHNEEVKDWEAELEEVVEGLKNHI